MSCGCNRTTLQGKQYCQDCMPDEYHWLVPVSNEPDPFLMDRHHAYIMPNNTIYVLSHDRTQAIDISGNDIDLTPYALKTELANKITELNQKLTTGLEGTKYYEGDGIRIDADKRIHSTVNLTKVNERIDAIEQAGNSPYKAGTGIEITSDLTINNTVTTDAIESRVQALEEKEDQNTTYTAGTGLQLSGTEFSVDPNDLPGLDQVDDLRDRVTTLEGKPDADTIYTAGSNVQISPTNVISATDTKYSAGTGLKLDSSNIFSLKAGSVGIGLGFTYSNPFITIGFINSGTKDVNTNTTTYTVNFDATNGTRVTNILLINPTNLESTKYPTTVITASSSKVTFSFTGPSDITYNSPATGGRVLIIAERIS